MKKDKQKSVQKRIKRENNKELITIKGARVYVYLYGYSRWLDFFNFFKHLILLNILELYKK
jgi:hypothetical protein